MNYPGKIKDYKKTITYSNRGMSLEDDINVTNEYYINNNIAIIYKKPTPIKIVKADYKNYKVTEGYFITPSTTDYNGIYKGKYIDFEAKETNNKFFPLANIKEHQLKHLDSIVKMGGIGFIIVRFNKLNVTYLLEYKYIDKCTKHINIDYFEEHGFIIETKYNPRLDYIKIIDVILEGLK